MDETNDMEDDEQAVGVHGDADPEEDDGDEYFDDGEIDLGRWPRWPLLVIAVIVIAAGLTVWRVTASSSHSTAAASGPEKVPIQAVPDLASASTTHTGDPVDGISCRTSMAQTVGYHIHILVKIYVNGQQERLPAGAGIAPPVDNQQLATGLFVDNGPDGCLYWLHVHANDGIVHVEAPNKQVFTLGNFFDVWGQPLDAGQVGPARGQVTAFENGKRFADPRSIPLISQAVIQLDVGTPVVPFKGAKFSVSGLCGAGVLSCSTKV